MRVNVYDHSSSGDGRLVGTRYADEALEAHCHGTEEELDRLYEEAVRGLQSAGRFWLTSDILIMSTENKR